MNSDLKETCSVLGVAMGGIGISFTELEHALKILILIGSLIYVWRKALKPRRKKRDEETDL